jgi:hypothetical protein
MREAFAPFKTRVSRARQRSLEPLRKDMRRHECNIRNASIFAPSAPARVRAKLLFFLIQFAFRDFNTRLLRYCAPQASYAFASERTSATQAAVRQVRGDGCVRLSARRRRPSHIMWAVAHTTKIFLWDSKKNASAGFARRLVKLRNAIRAV